MSEPFIVEVWGEPAGVVVPEGNAFRFHATARPFSSWMARRSARPVTPAWQLRD